MPYSANIEDIVRFLGEYSFYILANGVHIVLNQQVNIPREHKNIDYFPTEGYKFALLRVKK